jgi:bifunctional UDP-N-acetylglucosamine pyrophosphorylase / glucosamine-1-phosphate N-acetyltransferase
LRNCRSTCGRCCGGDPREVEDGAHIIGDVEIADGARVEAGAYIRGPALIGPGTEVRHGAYLRGNVLTGDGCLIGHASEGKTAILVDRGKAPHFSYIGDSVLGDDVNLGVRPGLVIRPRPGC